MKVGFRMRVLTLAVLGLVLAGCESIEIAKIKQDPSRFQGKTVQVEGTVTTSFGAMNMGGYEIQDETGSIYVISNHGVPSGGAKVVVQGTVFTGAMLAGRSLGVAIREKEHKVK